MIMRTNDTHDIEITMKIKNWTLTNDRNNYKQRCRNEFKKERMSNWKWEINEKVIRM